MLGIRAIASFVPSTGLDNYEQAETLGKDRAFVDERIGIEFLPRRSKDQDTSDLAAEAVRSLALAHPELDLAGIRALVVVTQNPDGRGLPHTSAIVQRKLDLPASVAAFDISLGCSGYVYGLYALVGFMQAARITSGLLITADPYSKILDGLNPATDMLFGDAATATWISDEAEWSLGASLFGTDGAGSDHLKNEEGLLHMNGRRVMEFAKRRVPEQIRAVLEAEGIEATDVDQFLLHQGSRVVVDSVSSAFGPVADRFPWGAARSGNTVSSTLPLLLQGLDDRPDVRTVVISGFGVGFSWGTAVLKRAAPDAASVSTVHGDAAASRLSLGDQPQEGQP